MPKPNELSGSVKMKMTSTTGQACLSAMKVHDETKAQSVKKLVKTYNTESSGLVGSSSSNRHEQVDKGTNHEHVEDENVVQDSGNNDEVLMKYQNFKTFDIVEDYSDHHYAGSNSTMTQPPKHWAKKIQKEWRILEKDLPDMIFVRVYESRMDLLRAVIKGAEGTPYRDGLFFFDVRFPKTYPHVPPEVYYHSGGLRINPNLYKSGYVCLSLLNTWRGSENEKWTPGVSTVLQVLVSIQGLILNAKPYFNEPGFGGSRGKFYGEKESLKYNERTLILSLKTMVYTMRKPPKHFEDLVIGHFRERARGILTRCEGYMKGRCGVGEGEETGSQGFRNDVKGYMKTLVAAFKLIGVVENFEEFLPSTENVTQKTKKKSLFGHLKKLLCK